MKRLAMAAMTAAFVACGTASAQVGATGTSPPLGMTSPLGIGAGSPVGPVGVPLGATELAAPGVSPSTFGTGVISQCAGIGGSIPQASFGTDTSTVGTMSGVGTTSGMGSSTMGTSIAGTSGSISVFDGGGITGTTSGACSTIGSSSLAAPAASASSPTGMGSLSVGRVGIPMGSTELGAGGLSPPPTLVIPSTPPVSTLGSTAPCPTTGMSTGMSTSSSSC
jgi:hypothetical protein